MSSLATLAAATKFVAPLFIHGDGRGAFGCEVVVPPVFLSEAEAREVIVEEAKKAGLYMVGGTTPVPGVTLDAYKNSRKPTTEKLTLDGFDKKKKVGFVFVSVEDSERWSEPSLSSVTSVQLKPLAEKVRKKVEAAKPEMTVGVFYDPMPQGKWDESKAAAAQRKISDREELRKQVRDFVKWLKSQGVI
jgi:hypothetical protein